jgi:hypothetical protein
MRNLRVERPGSFLPVYSLLLAALQLWLTWSLHARGRAWMVYDPAAILRFIPVLFAVALGLGAIALCLAAWVALRRGQRVSRPWLQASAVGSLIVVYALLTIAGYWLGYL